MKCTSALAGLLTVATALSSAFAQSTPDVQGTTVSVSSSASSAANSSAPTSTMASNSSTSTLSSTSVSMSSSLATAPGPVATGTNAQPVPKFNNFTCPTGQDVAYNITRLPIPNTPVSAATSFFSNFCDANANPVSSCSGNSVGANRSFTANGINVTETLANSTRRADGGIEVVVTSTSTIAEPALNATLFSYLQDITVYTNATSGNETWLQLWVNGCASSQPAGVSLINALLQQVGPQYVQKIQSAGGNSTSSSSAPPTSTMPPTSSSSAVSTSSAPGNSSSVASTSSSMTSSSAASTSSGNMTSTSPSSSNMTSTEAPTSTAAPYRRRIALYQ